MIERPADVRVKGGTGAIRLLLVAAAGVTGLGAVGVFLFGVIVTSGVYGSRLAWLLGVVLPLLVLGALFAWLAARARDSTAGGLADGQIVSSLRLRTFSVICLGLVAVPFALAAMLLLVYGVAFAIYGGRIAAHWMIH